MRFLRATVAAALVLLAAMAQAEPISDEVVVHVGVPEPGTLLLLCAGLLALGLLLRNTR